MEESNTRPVSKRQAQRNATYAARRAEMTDAPRPEHAEGTALLPVRARRKASDGVGVLVIVDWAIVDDGDFEALSAMQWMSSHGYAVARTGGRACATETVMHRHLMGLDKGDKRVVDHINMNKLDNRKANLRICEQGENLRNMPRRSHSRLPYKGIGLQRRATPTSPQRYTAAIRIGGKTIHLGTYATPEEAARAYDEAARKHHGKFARLNFPQDVD